MTQSCFLFMLLRECMEQENEHLHQTHQKAQTYISRSSARLLASLPPRLGGLSQQFLFIRRQIKQQQILYLLSVYFQLKLVCWYARAPASDKLLMCFLASPSRDTPNIWVLLLLACLICWFTAFC